MPVPDFLACSRRTLAVLSIVLSVPFLSFSQASTGPNNPGSAINVGDLADWSSPSNVSQSDNSRATVSGAALLFSSTLMTTGYGFAIPATDIVDGILVEIEKSRSNGAVFDLQVQLTNDGTSLIGENKAVGSAWSPSDGYVEYGGNTDNWGRAWTATEINSPSFG